MTGATQATARQREVLQFLHDFQAQHGYMPTQSEIAEGMGMKSANGAYEHLVAMEKRGLVTVQRSTARSIRLTDAALQLLRERAGLASPLPRPQQDLIALPVVDMAKVNRWSTRP